MSLAEKIALLRSEHNMSQGDLAEQMNVSRQSISKWETGASIPDLDKLIILSDLFGVTIDELAKPNKDSNTPQKTDIFTYEHTNTADNPITNQKILGFILLGVGILGTMFLLFLAPILTILALYLVLCGILCLIVKKHVGLVISWITIFPIFIFAPYFIRVTPGAIFNPYLYQNRMFIELALAYSMWFLIFLLVFQTLKHTRFKKYTPLIIGWIILYHMRFYLPVALGISPYNGSIYFIISLFSWLLLLVLLFFTIKPIVAYYKAKAKDSTD